MAFIVHCGIILLSVWLTKARRFAIIVKLLCHKVARVQRHTELPTYRSIHIMKQYSVSYKQQTLMKPHKSQGTRNPAALNKPYMVLYKTLHLSPLTTLCQVDYISCTTDVWSFVAQDSTLSLTAHCVLPEFDKISFVLRSATFNDLHTRENIANLIVTSLQS